MTTVHEVRSPADVRTFARLPIHRHAPGTYNPNAATDAALLKGTHALSPQLSVRGWLARDGEDVEGRIGLTTRPGDRVGRIGFFDGPCYGRTARWLMDVAMEAAAEAGCTSVIGPMDASFWVRYRLKVAGFDERPYLTEPLNPRQDHLVWESAGFEETDRYRSAIYHPAPRDLDLTRFAARRTRFEKQGYVIGPPQTSWEGLVADMHRLIHELYADFAGFEQISLAVFSELFGPLRRIADLDLVTMAYKDGRAEGFLVCLPDYGVGLTDPNPLRGLTTLVRTKLRPQRYVLAYIGAHHPGLGAAISHRFMTQMAERQAPVVGALTHVGKASEGYAAQHLRTRNEYVLLRRDL